MVFWVLPALPRVFHQGHVKYNLYWVWAKKTLEKEAMHAKIRDNSQEKHPAKKQKKQCAKTYSRQSHWIHVPSIHGSWSRDEALSLPSALVRLTTTLGKGGHCRM
jgi:hypothetical protein